MNHKHSLEDIGRTVAEQGLDGWLFYDFRGSDPLAASILGLSPERHCTRRWYYLVPAWREDGREPIKIVHRIESGVLDGLGGATKVYSSWRELEQMLAESLAGRRQIAMQYSPRNGIPYVAKVDAGTVELVRSLGVDVVSSADLVQRFEATLTEPQWESHLAASEILGQLKNATFDFIRRSVTEGRRAITEVDVQRFLVEEMGKQRMITDHPPIVAVDDHAADPHFAPSDATARPLKPGSLVLLDVWGKLTLPGSIFADYTWMAYLGDQPPEEMARVFEIVRNARDAALAAIRAAQRNGQPIRGCDVDDVCRSSIVDAGFGEFFIHRTGHSIHQSGHGNGANLDNLESQDQRRLIPRTLFSVEPGIYLPGRFGIRSEVNVFLPNDEEMIVTGPNPQRCIESIGG